ncbi:hypothetical protein VNO77_15992 [Canavalia gladiata]|uniref:Uncharacterized protein n=1 Tax=Canavalia gladiata TaxID=3824 RepID=A0AAN9M4P8_CANGL
MNAPSFGVPPHNAANAESTFPTCALRDGPHTRVRTILMFVPLYLTWHFLFITLDSPLPPQGICYAPKCPTRRGMGNDGHEIIVDISFSQINPQDMEMGYVDFPHKCKTCGI